MYSRLMLSYALFGLRDVLYFCHTPSFLKKQKENMLTN